MKSWLFILLLLGSSSAFSAIIPQSQCANLNDPIQKTMIPCLVEELIQLHFPQLAVAWKENRITFLDYHNPDYFLKTWQHSGYFKNNRNKRFYSIQINPILFTNPDKGPNALAIQGILAHELFHLVDYESVAAGGILKIALKEVFAPKNYERYTDLRTMQLGFAPGLKAYREWQYTQLSPHALKIKMKRYYTPAEITDWMNRP